MLKNNLETSEGWVTVIVQHIQKNPEKLGFFFILRIISHFLYSPSKKMNFRGGHQPIDELRTLHKNISNVAILLDTLIFDVQFINYCKHYSINTDPFGTRRVIFSLIELADYLKKLKTEYCLMQDELNYVLLH